MPSEKEEYGKGYGKRGMGFWILVYVVIAVVVYGAYYLIKVKKSGGSYTSPSSAGISY